VSCRSSPRSCSALSTASTSIYAGLHGIALALALASRPTTAWSLTACSVGASSLPLAIQALVSVLWLASAVAVVQHVVLFFAEQNEAVVAAP
jgi:hypothetical protein